MKHKFSKGDRLVTKPYMLEHYAWWNADRVFVVKSRIHEVNRTGHPLYRIEGESAQFSEEWFDAEPIKHANGCKTCTNNHDPGIPCRESKSAFVFEVGTPDFKTVINTITVLAENGTGDDEELALHIREAIGQWYGGMIVTWMK